MINLRAMYKVIGLLLFIEALILFACFGIVLFYGEDDAMAFLLSVFINPFTASILRHLSRNSNDILSRCDAYLVVTPLRIVSSFFGTSPFILSGYTHDFADVCFGTTPGFATTGATIIDDIEVFPHAPLSQRSLTQRTGSSGIIFFAVALLPSMVGGSVQVSITEATGPIKSKLHPRLSTSTKWILIVYLVLVVACIGCFILYGMNWFDAVNYSVITTATGSFPIHSSSTEYLHSPVLEYICTIFCFLSGVSFALLHTAVVKWRPKALFKSSELKFYPSVVILFSLFIILELMINWGYDLELASRPSAFRVVSSITTAGLLNDDTNQRPHVTWAILATCMFTGARPGSTSGGFKCIRAVMLLKIIRNELKQVLRPNAVLPLKVNDTNVPYRKRGTLLVFLTMYLILRLLTSSVLMMAHIDSTNSIIIIPSCTDNTGPTLGLEIGPTMGWSVLPGFVKRVCILLILIGCLGVFSMLVILSPAFWKDN